MSKWKTYTVTALVFIQALALVFLGTQLYNSNYLLGLHRENRALHIQNHRVAQEACEVNIKASYFIGITKLMEQLGLAGGNYQPFENLVAGVGGGEE